MQDQNNNQQNQPNNQTVGGSDSHMSGQSTSFSDHQLPTQPSGPSSYGNDSLNQQSTSESMQSSYTSTDGDIPQVDMGLPQAAAMPSTSEQPPQQHVPNVFSDQSQMHNDSQTMQQNAPSIGGGAVPQNTYIAPPTDQVGTTPTIEDTGGVVPPFDPLRGVDNQQIVQQPIPQSDTAGADYQQPQPAPMHYQTQEPVMQGVEQSVPQQGEQSVGQFVQQQPVGQMNMPQQNQGVPQTQTMQQDPPLPPKRFSFPFFLPFFKKKT